MGWETLYRRSEWSKGRGPDSKWTSSSFISADGYCVCQQLVENAFVVGHVSTARIPNSKPVFAEFVGFYGFSQTGTSFLPLYSWWVYFRNVHVTNVVAGITVLIWTWSVTFTIECPLPRPTPFCRPSRGRMYSQPENIRRLLNTAPDVKRTVAGLGVGRMNDYRLPSMALDITTIQNTSGFTNVWKTNRFRVTHIDLENSEWFHIRIFIKI